MKKVLVVFTGGTIGTTVQANALKATQGKAFKLIQTYQETHPNAEIAFTAIEPLTILSENLEPQHWTQMIKAIEDAQYAEYDGIILTHGTDTLAITSAVLSYYFHAIPLPLLLVSSHLSLDDTQANGPDNFLAALAFIEQSLATGVFVPYRNPDEDFTSIFYGTCIAMSAQLSSDFAPVGGLFGTFKHDTFHKHKTLTPSMPKVSLKARFTDRLLYIKPYPGIDYRHYNLEGVTCVLHDLYHSGTVPIEPVLNFIDQCDAKGIAVYFAPICQSSAYYESSLTLQNSSATLLYNISIEAALAKLYFAYGNFSKREEIDCFLLEELHHEFSCACLSHQKKSI